MADPIRHVVATEGPAHSEVLHARLRDANSNNAIAHRLT